MIVRPLSIDEIGPPPDAPMIGAGGPSIVGAVSAHSQNSVVRGTGAAWAALGAGFGQLLDSAANAEHQNKTAKFHQEMAKVGKNRIPPDEMAKLVQRKDDV